jgi:hypothetical protein
LLSFHVSNVSKLFHPTSKDKLSIQKGDRNASVASETKRVELFVFVCCLCWLKKKGRKEGTETSPRRKIREEGRKEKRVALFALPLMAVV